QPNVIFRWSDTRRAPPTPIGRAQSNLARLAPLITLGPGGAVVETQGYPKREYVCGWAQPKNLRRRILNVPTSRSAATQPPSAAHSPASAGLRLRISKRVAPESTHRRRAR